VFLKYISDRFTDRRAAIEAELAAEAVPDERRADFLEDRDEYAGHNVFWVPADARWDTIQARAKLPSIGGDIDAAMDLIEKENPVIRGVLPRNYGREGLDKGRLGQLVDLIGSIGFTQEHDHGSDDVLGRVYEYFLGQFAGKETGKETGAFYTPRSVVRTLVEMLEPFHGRVFDPACGSGGMFVGVDAVGVLLGPLRACALVRDPQHVGHLGAPTLPRGRLRQVPHSVPRQRRTAGVQRAGDSPVSVHDLTSK
jgi:type I restriction enzyme M protein